MFVLKCHRSQANGRDVRDSGCVSQVAELTMKRDEQNSQTKPSNERNVSLFEFQRFQRFEHRTHDYYADSATIGGSNVLTFHIESRLRS